MATQYTSAYRAVLREVSKASIGKLNRNQSIPRTLRTIFDEHRARPREKRDDAQLAKDVGNAVLFLRSQRVYKALLDRYNPTHDMTQQERTRATARRVGLDLLTERKTGSGDD